MKWNASTDSNNLEKNFEKNALDNAIKYLTCAGFKNIVIIASTDNMDVVQCEWGGLRRKTVHTGANDAGDAPSRQK